MSHFMTILNIKTYPTSPSIKSNQNTMRNHRTWSILLLRNKCHEICKNLLHTNNIIYYQFDYLQSARTLSVLNLHIYICRFTLSSSQVFIQILWSIFNSINMHLMKYNYLTYHTYFANKCALDKQCRWMTYRYKFTC